MERLTHDDCYEELSNEPNFSKVIKRLRAYEDTGLTPEEISRLTAQVEQLEAELAGYREAEQDGRLVVLPCKVGSTVYTVDEVSYPCHTCEDMGRMDVDECYRLSRTPPFTSAPYECPTVYEINEHICEGFSVHEDDNGKPGVSLAGEWGYEGLETFTGRDGKQYYSREAAEAALQRDNTELEE